MPTFFAAPTVDLLRQLVPNSSLKQSLAKAVRLWVILQFVYDDDLNPVLPDKFSYKDWEKAFFRATHQFARDTTPTHHDPECRCARSLEYWLFEANPDNPDRASWSQAFCEAVGLSPNELTTLLDQSDRLFAVTGRSLESDFKALVDRKWLQYQPKSADEFYTNRYEKVETLPTILTETAAENAVITDTEYIQNNLAEFVETLAQPIRNVQRFFLHVEYVVPIDLSHQIRKYQAQLKQCWDQPEVPPIHLNYCSAREFQTEFDWLVYPVCVFYYQRAPYLFAYGHQRGSKQLEWYDFRLDHITDLDVLDWQHPDLHPELLARRHNPPTPNDIHKAMEESWGFEFYRPSEPIILRFNQYFYASYIEPTERASLFKLKMTRDQVIARTATLKAPEGEALRKRLKRCSEKDIYCQLEFRSGDRNILMRLRAWGPNVEIILPYSLRAAIAEEIQKMNQMYH